MVGPDLPGLFVMYCKLPWCVLRMQADLELTSGDSGERKGGGHCACVYMYLANYTDELVTRGPRAMNTYTWYTRGKCGAELGFSDL